MNCQMCGMPGAVLYFPGGYLCPGGCKLPFITAGGCLTQVDATDATADAEARLKEAIRLLSGIGIDTSTGRVAIRQNNWFIRRNAWLEREAKIEKEKP